VRKYIAIVLLSLLFINVIGVQVFYYFQSLQLKAEMKAFLKTTAHKDVETIVLSSTTAVEWENESEFRYNNEMYDVIDKKTEGHQQIIRCISDKKETALFKTFQKTTKQNSKQKANLLSKFISIQFVPNKEIQTTITFLSTLIAYSHSSLLLSEQSRDILKPPPQIV